MLFPRIQGLLYRNLLKPILFKFDPEVIHDFFVSAGYWLGKLPFAKTMTSILFSYKSRRLRQTVLGIKFKNPIGLVAGFDKNARLTQILPSVGFGFEVVGSITGEKCAGNSERPRLWRLPKSKGLVVFYGLMNDGCEAIGKRLSKLKFRFPIGVSIAKTNDDTTVELEAGIRDYIKAVKTLKDTGDFFVINVSCPNAFGGEPFTAPERLDLLLAAIDKEKVFKPVMLKLPVDISTHELDELIQVCDRHHVHGMILSNLTKKRDRSEIMPEEIKGIDKGGISGVPARGAANGLIAHAYQAAGDRYVIVGVGGVFTAQDAYEKIKLGASLVGMITGMIYEGPQVIGRINRDLVKLLKKDGFKNISEAIGSAHR
jgi:dihydroorotate dehydrogenase